MAVPELLLVDGEDEEARLGLKGERTAILAFFLFVRNGYVQHADVG